MKKSSRAGRRRPETGWREGTVQDFLGLSDAEAALVDMKAALAVRLHRRRRGLAWSQTELAERLGSGQSRVAKMEAAHPPASQHSTEKGGGSRYSVSNGLLAAVKRPSATGPISVE